MFFLPLLYCCSCNNSKNVSNTKDETIVDSTAYKQVLEHAVEEKLLPKYQERRDKK